MEAPKEGEKWWVKLPMDINNLRPRTVHQITKKVVRLHYKRAFWDAYEDVITTHKIEDVEFVEKILEK